MQKIVQLIKQRLPLESFDALAVGMLDFKNMSYQALEANQFNGAVEFKDDPTIYFDLASLTKVLTNSLSYFLASDAFDDEMLWCLNHQAGLPSWGLLPQKGWREQILSYPIKRSSTLYSDFSALRVMLELQKKGINQKQLCQKIWDPETLFWLDLPFYFPTLQYGYKEGKPNFGQVHDPNAWVIRDYCSHAGIFSTIDGLCRTLINYQQHTGFIEQISRDLQSHQQRFSFGWDRVMDPQETLAGKGCSGFTFGHLGFTGTSIWIDPQRMRGHVILSNATKYYWHDKKGLNDIRREVGELVWSL
jgi:hypothetical protein